MELRDLVAATTRTADAIEQWLEGAGKDSGIKPAELAKAFFHLKTEYEALDKQRKRIYKVLDIVDKNVFPALLEAHDMDMIRVPELGRSFSVRQMSSASMLDKEGGMAWLRENGHEDLIQETVNSGTLASFFRSLALDEGIDPPEEFFKVSTYNKIGVNKYTPKA